MVLKIQITRNGEVLFEMPLEADIREATFSKRLERELKGFDEEVEGIAEFFDTLANETRLRMLEEMLWSDMRFSDFMSELGLNPKIVNENLKMLERRKLVQKDQRRYSVSPTGFGCFLTLCIALRRVMEELE